MKEMYNLTELATMALDVSFATVNRWENGKCIPSYEAMRRLKKYCELYKLVFDLNRITSEGTNNE